MGIRQGNRKRARELRRGLRRKRLALALVAAFAMPVAPALAQSLPEDGTVTYGAATIDTIGNTMTIHQSTQGAIIDWGTFNIATGNTVDFMQPDVTSVTLNRVNLDVPSLIDGTLTANGSVFLINSAGITFGSGAQVNVGGLIASTLDTDDEDFKSGLASGEFKFVNWTDSYAPINNSGNLNTQYGMVFIGPNLSNSGSLLTGGKVLFIGSDLEVDLTYKPSSSVIDWTSGKSTLGGNINVALEDGSSITSFITQIEATEGTIWVGGHVSLFGEYADLIARKVSIGAICDGIFCGAGYLDSHTRQLYIASNILQVLSGNVGGSGGPEERSRITLSGDVDGIATSMHFSGFSGYSGGNTVIFDAGVEISAIPGATIVTHATSFDIDDTAQILADTWKLYAPTWEIMHSGDGADSAFLTDGLLSNTLDNGTSIGIYADGASPSGSIYGIYINEGVTISHASDDVVALNFVSDGRISGNKFGIESTGGALDLSFKANGGPVEFIDASLISNDGNISIQGVGRSHGVHLDGSTISAGDGDINITGMGTGTESYAQHYYYYALPRGVLLHGTNISTTGGNITVVGDAAAGTGVVLSDLPGYGGNSIATTTGDISVISTGLFGLDAADVPLSTDSGNIHLEGHALSGTGLSVGSAGLTNNGDITLIGSSASGNGVVIRGNLTSHGGAISIHGLNLGEGDGHGVFVDAGSSLISEGDVRIVGSTNSMTADESGGFTGVSLDGDITSGGIVVIEGHALGTGSGHGVFVGAESSLIGEGSINVVGTTASMFVGTNSRRFGGVSVRGDITSDGDIGIEGEASGAGGGPGVVISAESLLVSGGSVQIEGTTASRTVGDSQAFDAVWVEGGIDSDGSIEIEGDGIDGFGVRVSGDLATVGGSINITGESQGATGVSVVNAHLSSNAGAITITGLNTAAIPLDNDDIGVVINSGNIDSDGGAISITGTGLVNGLSIFDSSMDAGSGSVEITGRGMTGFAMFLHDFDIATAGGNVSLHGAGPFGISWFGGGVNAGSGALSLIGFGGGLDFHDVDLIGATVSLTGAIDGSDSALLLDGDSSIQATNGMVVLQASNDGNADAIKLEGHVSSDIGVVLAPYNVNDAILLGAGNGFSLTNAELAMIDSPLLVIGGAQQAGSIRVAEAVAWDGDLTLQNQGGSGDIDIQAALDVGDHTLALASGGNISQTSAGAITAHSLLAIAAGDVLLASADNNVTANTLSGSAGGDFKYEDVDDLAIGNVSAQGYSVGAPSSPGSPGFPAGLMSLSAVGITAAGNVVVGTASGDLTLGADVRGNTINLVAAETFQNSAAANLFASDGWRVWARTWEGEQRGGLAGDAAFDLYGCTYGQNCVGLAQGNQFVYQDIRETPIAPVIDGADPDDDGGPLEQVHAGMVCPVGANAADPLGKGSNNDDLAREWSKTRHRIRLSGCIDSSNEGGCRF